ncbi:MAG: MmcQ/YjbR family DNA-binding protein [Planctomycetes bacterium]|nr:MmcQ/YjbR family DNA-binding protein [Planctomycetota bacterium]
MDLARAADHLLARALALPGAWEDHPWGERVAKVGKKVFVFFGRGHRQGAQLTLAVKLPRSGVAALDRPECAPTGYGLGKSGWVTAQYERGDRVPLELIEAWIEESWRSVAPKRFVVAHAGGPARPVTAKPGVRKRARPASSGAQPARRGPGRARPRRRS